MYCQFTCYCNKLIKLWSADKGFFFSSRVYVDHFSAFQGVSFFFRHLYNYCWLKGNVVFLVQIIIVFQNTLLTRPNLTNYYSWECFTNKQTNRKKREWVEIVMLLLPCEQALTSEASGEKTCEQRAMERTLSYSRPLSLAACSCLFTLSPIGELAVRLV